MKKSHVVLSAADKSYLESLLSKGTLRVRVYKRALALQRLDTGCTYQSVGREVGVGYATVSRWASCYRTSGLSFLEDKARSGRPPVYDGDMRSKIVALACSTPPSGYGRWSLRLLSDKLVELDICAQVSHTDVGRVLKKANFSLTESVNGALGS